MIMRKFLFLVFAAAAVLCLMSFANFSETKVQANSCEITAPASDFKTITVYKITVVGRNGAASKQSVSAEFDRDKMELKVVEKRNGKNYTMSYSVVRNPYKGYSDDPRGSYDYCADCYYFN